MTEQPKSFPQLLEDQDRLPKDYLVEQPPERVPDALEIAIREAARRQARQLQEMSRRDRYERSTNHRTTRRREGSC